MQRVSHKGGVYNEGSILGLKRCTFSRCKVFGQWLGFWSRAFPEAR